MSARLLRPSSLVALESKTYPGTTDEVVCPLLEKRSEPKRRVQVVRAASMRDAEFDAARSLRPRRAECISHNHPSVGKSSTDGIPASGDDAHVLKARTARPGAFSRRWPQGRLRAR